MKINKAFYKSKTMWASILVAIATTILPDAKEIVQENPQAVMGVVGFIFGLLRIKTDSAVSLSEKRLK